MQDPADSPPTPVNRLSLVVTAAIAFVAVLGAFLTIGSGTQLMNVGFGVWFCELWVFLGVPWVLLQLTGWKPAETTGFLRPWGAGVAWAFVLGIINAFALVLPTQYGMQKLMPKSLVEMFDISFIFDGQSGFELLLVVTGVGLLAPLGEEFFFRGVLQRAALKVLSPWKAIFLVSVIFSAFHFDPVGFPARLELGILFGVLAWKTGSLWPGIAAHAANNLLSTVLFFTARGSDDSDELPEWLPLVMIVVGLLVMTGWILLARRYRSTVTAPPFASAMDTPRTGSLKDTAAIWVLGLSLCSPAMLMVIDRRGVELNFKDMIATERLKKPKPQDSAEKRAAWDTLMKQRADARKGALTIDDYVKAREGWLGEFQRSDSGAADAGH